MQLIAPTPLGTIQVSFAPYHLSQLQPDDPLEMTIATGAVFMDMDIGTELFSTTDSICDQPSLISLAKPKVYLNASL